MRKRRGGKAGKREERRDGKREGEEGGREGRREGGREKGKVKKSYWGIHSLIPPPIHTSFMQQTFIEFLLGITLGTRDTAITKLQ